MKKSILSLLVSVALAVFIVGAVQAEETVGVVKTAELDQTAEMPDIIGAMTTFEATLLVDTEMDSIQGTAYPYRWYYGWHLKASPVRPMTVSIGVYVNGMREGTIYVPFGTIR